MPLKNFEERDGVIICRKCGSANVKIRSLPMDVRLRYDIDTVYICENCGEREYC